MYITARQSVNRVNDNNNKIIIIQIYNALNTTFLRACVGVLVKTIVNQGNSTKNKEQHAKTKRSITKAEINMRNKLNKQKMTSCRMG